MDLYEAIAYASSVARRLTSDPEGQSIANATALKAVRTCPEGGELKSWIAVCVRRDVWYYWRQKKRRGEEQRTEVWWSYRVSVEDTVNLDISIEDWQLLWEHHIDGVIQSVMARRRGINLKTLREMIAAAETRIAGALK